MSDRIAAPLVFVNGADTKSAQMFTLAHELASVARAIALSDSTAAKVSKNVDMEKWCNRVAAETLVPLELFKKLYRRGEPVDQEMQRLARVFKVSTLVVLRRMFDAGGLTTAILAGLQRRGRAAGRNHEGKRSGGRLLPHDHLPRQPPFHKVNCYLDAGKDGSTFTEAFRLLGCKKMSTFAELGQHVGVDVGGVDIGGGGG